MTTHQQAVAARLAQLRREKSAREHRDIMQTELADVIGTTPETYSRYENARRKVPDEALLALAEYYGVSPAFIRYGTADFPSDRPTVKTYSAEEIDEFRRAVEADDRARAAASARKKRKRDAM